jgi:hypothetical protein
MLSHAMLLYLSAMFTGIERGGVPGLAPVAVTTLIATSGSAALSRRLIGLLIPVYCASDLYACYIYKESIRWDILRSLVLPVAVGMFFAFLTLGVFEADDIRTYVGIGLAVLFLILALKSMSAWSGSIGEDEGEDNLLPTTRPLTPASSSVRLSAAAGSATPSNDSSPPRLVPANANSAQSQVSNLSGGGGGVGVWDGSRSPKGANPLSAALHKLARPLVLLPFFQALMGFLAGYLTVVANVAGLLVIVFLMAMNLPARAFNGTRSAILLICNGCKLPGQMLLGAIQMNATDLTMILPLVVASVMCTYATEKFFVTPRMTQAMFEHLTWALLAFSSLKLMFIF